MLAVVVGALALSLALAGCTAFTLPKAFSGVREPSIIPATDQQGFQTVDREFDFETQHVKISVPVDSAVYAGARSAEKSTVFIGRDKPANWLDGHYRSFIDEKHQEPFFSAVLSALHEVRQKQDLDSSQYVELVTSMVQTMEYRVDPVSLAAKFPIETFADGYGDCDDKMLLAAALLSRDGYDVAVLVFEPEKHVALGVRAPGLEFKDTGYGYVEMTQPSLVGVAPEKLAGDIELKSEPTVIRIGSGQQSFGAGDQISYIQKRLVKVQASTERMSKRITADKAELEGQRATLESAKQTAESATDPASAAAAAQRYNDLVKQYNARVDRLNALAAQYNSLVDAERYAAQHQTARPQIYELLRGLKL
jgi:hypothetical protein